MSENKYCSPESVATLLGRSANYFTASTTPTVTQVREVIERKSAEIEARTNRAWRVRASNEEYHDLKGSYRYGRGRRLYLRHLGVLTLDASAGDSLAVWNGSAWEEWLGAKTEGRNASYWVNPDLGFLYIIGVGAWHSDDSVRITYRYNEGQQTTLNEGGTLTADATTITVTSTTGFAPSGYAFLNNEVIYYSGKTTTTFTGCTRGARSTTASTHADGSSIYFVPDEIQNLCAKMVLMDLLIGDDYSVLLPEGGSNIQQSDKYSKLRREVDSRLNSLQLWRTPE